MADFSYDTGFGDADPYGVLGTGSYAPVLTDVSNGSPPQQPSTPTGNGTGVFIDSGQQNGMFNLLGQALNYAITRDQQKMTAVYGPQVTGAYYPAAGSNGYPPGYTGSVSLQASANSRLLTYLLIGGAIWLAVRK
jgi:hypothetical protein